MRTFLIDVTGCLHIQHSSQMCSGPAVALHGWDHVTSPLWFSCLPQHSDEFSHGAHSHLSGRTTSVPAWTFPTSTVTPPPHPLEKGPNKSSWSHSYMSQKADLKHVCFLTRHSKGFFIFIENESKIPFISVKLHFSFFFLFVLLFYKTYKYCI